MALGMETRNKSFFPWGMIYVSIAVLVLIFAAVSRRVTAATILYAIGGLSWLGAIVRYYSRGRSKPSIDAEK